MGRHATSKLMWIAATLLIVACQDPPPPDSPASFNRPEHVAFACLDLYEDPPVAVAEGCCTVTEWDLCDVERHADSGVAWGEFVPHALVTQTASGEVAAVDLLYGKVKDSRRDIPGFTFVATGELPTAIVVGRYGEVGNTGPHHTYVANHGSADITVMKTSSLRKLDPEQNAFGQPPVALAGRPQDMVLVSNPEGDSLIVTLPDEGKVLHIPIAADGTLPVGNAAGTDGRRTTEITLSRSLANLPAPATAGEQTPDPYRAGDECSAYLLQPQNTTPAATVAAPDLTQAPRPGAMVVDTFCRPGEECTPRVLIADENLPVIHVLSVTVDGAVAEAPLLPGVPTTAVVVTPWVPTAAPGMPLPDGAEDSTQYVYAIDAIDGSVLVLQNGRVLNVNSDPIKRNDRLAMNMPHALGAAVASSLEVLYPGFEPDSNDGAQHLAGAEAIKLAAAEEKLELANAGDNEQLKEDETAALSDAADEHNTACFGANRAHDAGVLRGVFVAVGLIDGTVQIIDIHDLQLENCSECPIALRRHSPRIGEGYRGVYEAPELIGPVVSVKPVFGYGDRVLQIRLDGTTVEPRITGLDCIVCEPEQNNKARAYPDENQLEGEELPDAGMPDAGPEMVADDSVMQDDELADDELVAVPTITRISTCAPATPAVDDLGAALLDEDGEAIILPAESLICAEVDPWVIADDDWRLYYQGLITGTQGVGSFETAGSDIWFNTQLEPCGAGVLGSDETDAPPHVLESDEPDAPPATSTAHGHRENERVGDQLVIIGDFPTSGQWEMWEGDGVEGFGTVDELGALRDSCEALEQALEDNPGERLGFVIKSAQDVDGGGGRLFVDGSLSSEILAAENDIGASDWEWLDACFHGAPLAYRVHAFEAYTVVGLRTGVVHRVIADPADGHCMNDPNVDDRLGFRAWPGLPFENHAISFKLAGLLGSVPTNESVALFFSTFSRATGLFFDGRNGGTRAYQGVLPVDIRYNRMEIDRLPAAEYPLIPSHIGPPIGRLYIIDVHARGLIPVPLTPFPFRIDRSRQFN